MSMGDDPSMHDVPRDAEAAERARLAGRVHADLNVVARIGGRQLTLGHFGAIGWTPDVEREAAAMIYRARHPDDRNVFVSGREARHLPMGAFDWPIYRAALYPGPTDAYREDFTCGCGLYVHPSRRNPVAVHIDDCRYRNLLTSGA